jgi:xanthine dehydrogenase YagS FAD-binding subunit
MQRAERRSHEQLRLRPPGDGAGGGRRCSTSGRRLYCRRHKPSGSDEGRRESAESTCRHQSSSHLDKIEALADGGVRVGALVRNADLAHDRDFARRFPAVAEALLSGASAQIRNAATVGGNLMQRTRCAYFYDVASACNKRSPGSGCDARGGDNRLQAILGWSEHCIATHPSDFCVPLVALDAVVEVEGSAGRREIPLEAFHRFPAIRPTARTCSSPAR